MRRTEQQIIMYNKYSQQAQYDQNRVHVVMTITVVGKIKILCIINSTNYCYIYIVIRDARRWSRQLLSLLLLYYYRERSSGRTRPARSFDHQPAIILL